MIAGPIPVETFMLDLREAVVGWTFLETDMLQPAAVRFATVSVDRFCPITRLKVKPY